MLDWKLVSAADPEFFAHYQSHARISTNLILWHASYPENCLPSSLARLTIIPLPMQPDQGFNHSSKLVYQ